MEEIKPEDVKPIQLLISMLPNGQVQVAGPITNRGLCYSMLELAKEAIYEFKVKNEKPVIEKGGILGFARRRI